MRGSGQSRRRGAPLAIACVAAAAVGAAGALLLLGGSGSTEDEAQRPSPEDLPPDVVGIVTHVPGDPGTVTRGELEHSLELEAAEAGAKPAPEPGEEGYGELRESALTTLLEAAWLEGQAAEMGIAVSEREVDEERRKIEDENFEDEGEYDEFLEESRLTPEDVDQRVRLQILSERIQEAIPKSRRPTVAERQQADQERLAEFVDAYNRRWRSRTVCAPAFVTEQCSNGEKPAQPEPAGSPGES